MTWVSGHYQVEVDVLDWQPGQIQQLHQLHLVEAVLLQLLHFRGFRFRGFILRSVVQDELGERSRPRGASPGG